MGRADLRIDLLAGLLDAASARHRVIARNVANVNTPNYRRQEVAFEADLAKALADGRGAERVRPRIVESAADPARPDGNSVDIDREMGDLTTNGVLYAAAAQLLAGRLAVLRSAITGR